jgi:hypothetical protein
MLVLFTMATVGTLWLASISPCCLLPDSFLAYSKNIKTNSSYRSVKAFVLGTVAVG